MLRFRASKMLGVVGGVLLGALVLLVASFASQPVAAQQPGASQAQPLRLSAQGFSQDGRWLGVAFIVENPNAGLAIENVPYQIAAYDAAGTVLETSSGTVRIVYPGQRFGVAVRLVLPEEARAARTDVQLAAGRFVASSEGPGLSADTVTYRPDRFFPKVTGVIRNSYPQTVTNVEVYAVGFDASGTPIGGGSTWVQFVPANGQAAVEIFVTFGVKPARVELFPTLTSISQRQ